MGRARLAALLAGLVGAAAIVVAIPAGAASTSTSDRAIARAGVLVRTDFPSGWKQGPRSDSSDAELEAKAKNIDACKPFIAFSKVNRANPHATSPNFDHSQSNVTNAVSVYPSDAKAVAAMRTFSDTRVPRCLERLFTTVFRGELAKKKSVAKQVTSVTTHIAPIDGVRIGDEAVVYQGTVDVSLKGGTTQTIGLGVLSIRTGRAIDGYSWTSDTDISAALQPAIVTSIDRLQKAESAA
jgi:hypothetical protein